MITRLFLSAGLGLIAGLCAVGVARSTTLAPLTVDQQIADAETIFRGRVTWVASEMRTTDQGRAIFTVVTFERLAAYKGDVAERKTLEFLGGKVGEVEMVVDGMPVFAVGEEWIVFASAEKNLACPVIGWTDGALQVADGDVEVPARMKELMGSGSAVVSALGEPTSAIAKNTGDLSQFEAGLRERIREVKGK